MRGANRNVIVSHGGKHGRSAGTYLKGQVVPSQAARHVPSNLLRNVSAAEAQGPEGGQTPATKDRPQAKAQTPKKVPAHRAITNVTPTEDDLAQQKPLEAPKTAEVTVPDPVAKTAEPAPEAPTEVDPLATEDPAPAEPEADPLAVDEDAPEATEVEMPTSKRQLTRMAKADAYALAVDLGLDVPENPDDILAPDLKAKLASELGLT